MKYLIVLSLLLTSCGPGRVWSCDFYTAGLCVSSALEVDPAEIEQVVRTVEYFSNQYYDVKNLPRMLEKHKVALYMTNQQLVDDCRDLGADVYICDDISGVNFDGDQMYVEYYGGCLAWTALAHELLHSVDRYYLGGPHGHSTPYMFDEWGDDPNLTIERRAFIFLRNTLNSCKHRI